MKNKKFRSIRVKLVILLAFSALIALILSIGSMFFYTYNELEIQSKISLSNTTEILARNLSAPIEFDDPMSADLLLETLEIDPMIEGAFVLMDEGKEFTSYIQQGIDKKRLEKKLETLYKSNDIKRYIEYIDSDDIIVSSPIYLQKEYIATFCIVSSTKSLKESIKKQFIVALIISAISLIIVIFIALRLQSRFTRPIFILKEAMEKITKNSNYYLSVQNNSNDEFGALFDGFNNMIKKIHEQNLKLENHAKILKETIEIKTKSIHMQKDKLEKTLATMDQNVVFSKSDLSGRITHVSEAFCQLSGYTQEELIGKSHSVLRDKDSSKKIYNEMWKSLDSKACWFGKIKNKRKDGTPYWIFIKIEPNIDSEQNHIGYYSIAQDITAQYELQELSLNLEKKVELQTKDLRKQLRVVKIAERKQNELVEEVHNQKQFIQALLDSQEQLIITTDGKEMKTANETFLDFFAVESIEDFMETYDAKCVCETFNKNAPEGYLQIKIDTEIWIDYIISRPFNQTHKVMISMGDTDFIFSVTGAKLPGEDTLKSAVFTNITEMERAKQEIEDINKHTRESIEYAGLIQSALIPDNNKFRKYFKDYFVIWHPKDTVGGDIYLFEELRDDDECLLMVIDCTGHGVPGAFVTMLVKAIERQIVSKIKHSDEVVSPAKLLSVFNSSMKHLLKQNNVNSISNAGFDGQIMYYNRKENIIKVASARNEIFYYQDDILHVIKGDRHSVGYKDSDINYDFTDHIIDTTKETTLYLSTDGFWDQNGGPKDLPFGKKRLKRMLDEIHSESMADQQEEFLYMFEEYRDGFEVNDDVTVIAMKV